MNSNYSISDALDYMKNLPDNSVNLILTDPPFFVNFKNSIYDDSENNFDELVPKYYKEFNRILVNNGFAVIMVGLKNIHKWIQEGINAGLTYKNIIAVRNFNNGSPSAKNNFGFQFQPILIFSKGSGRSFNKVDFIPTSEGWYKDKRNKNPKPYTYSYPNWIKSEWCFATAKNSRKNVHPNEKNVKLLKFFIGLMTEENDVVLDPFMGSGSTLEAAKRLNRVYLGCDLNPKCYDITKERLDNIK